MKRILPLFLIALLCLSLTAMASEPALPYTDVSREDWFFDPVNYVTQRDLMQGDGTGRFLPEQPMTRGMVVTLLHRMACEPSSDLQTSFPDVSDSHYAAKAIRWACDTDIAAGNLDGTFSPNARITREQASVFFYRYAKAMQLNPIPRTAMLSFSDSAAISEYAKDAVSWAVSIDMLQGSKDALKPGATASRAEIAAMVMRYQKWAEQRGGAKLLPGELISLLGQKIRAVRSGDGLYVPAQSAEIPKADEKYAAAINGRRYLSLDYYTEILGCVEGDAPDGTHYIAKNEPLILPQAGADVPVLMYHAVSDDVWGMEELFVGPEMMEQQLKYLKTNGYDPIWFEDLADLDQYDKPVILTFDDGYRDNYTTLYPLLKKYQIKATFFIIGETVGWENKMNWAQLYELSQSGLVSVQSHTYSHDRLDLQPAQQQEYELQAGQAMVAAITGKVSRVLCYPGGRYNADTLRLAPQYYDFALKWDGGLYTTGDDPYQINRFYVARSTDMEAFKAFLP